MPPYLRELYREPLLTPSRERALFLKFNFRKCQFVAARRKLEPQFARSRDPLHMIGVSVCGNDHLALGQVEIHLADEVDNLFDGVNEADVDENKLAAAVDEVDINAKPMAGLVIQLNDALIGK